MCHVPPCQWLAVKAWRGTTAQTTPWPDSSRRWRHQRRDAAPWRADSIIAHSSQAAPSASVATCNHRPLDALPAAPLSVTWDATIHLPAHEEPTPTRRATPRRASPRSRAQRTDGAQLRSAARARSQFTCVSRRLTHLTCGQYPNLAHAQVS